MRSRHPARVRETVKGIANRSKRQYLSARRSVRNLLAWSRRDPEDWAAVVDLALSLSEPPVAPELRPGRRVRHSCHDPGTPRGVICSFAVGTHVNLLSIAAPTLIEYGQRHGWDVVLSTEGHLSEGRAASWGKLRLIKELLQEYELVWWIDADALIVDSSTDIREELRDGKDLYLVEHWFPYPNTFAASCGVMLWRRSEWALSFLDLLWESQEYAELYPWENAALLDALGFTSKPIFVHQHPTEHVRKLLLLRRRWNSVYTDPSTRPLVHHHGGNLTLEQRRRLMLEDFARTRRGLSPEMTPSDAWEQPEESLPKLLTPDFPARRMSRDDIPVLLNQRGLLGLGVEIGVYAGEFSARLLRRWKGDRLVSVDPWLSAADYDDISNVSQGEFDLLYEAAHVRLARFGDRSEIWRLTSEAAAQRVRDKSADFVYIDARHDQASVAADLALWMPKVRPGGILAGHDYLNGRLPEGDFGVKSAVDTFFRNCDLPVHVTGDPSFPSWLVEIPG